MGQNKKYFKLHKFRSMKMSTPHDVPTHMLDNPDQYITKVGKFLRAHSLDELPQIWDIFIGDMSLIGPRPLLVAYLPRYNEFQRHRHDVRPGLTGYAQAHGRNAVSYINSYISGDAVNVEGIDSEDFNTCQARLLEMQDYLKKVALEIEEKLK